MSNIDSTSATIFWTPDPIAVSWQIQYRIHPAQGGGGNGTAIAGAGSSSRVISELAVGTQYQSRIRKNCGSNNLSPWRFKPFATLGPKEALVELGNIEIYPNPATDVLVMSYSTTTDEEIQVRMLDMLGRTTLQQNVEVFEGTNPVSFDVSQLQAGTYIIEINNGSQKTTETFVIAR